MVKKTANGKGSLIGAGHLTKRQTWGIGKQGVIASPCGQDINSLDEVTRSGWVAFWFSCHRRVLLTMPF
jgi:hypothetical protein